MGWIIKSKYYAQSSNPQHRVSKSFGAGGVARYQAWVVDGKEQRLIGTFDTFKRASGACDALVLRQGNAASNTG